MGYKSSLKIIKNRKDLLRVIQYCKDTGYACVDFETEGKGRPFYIPDSHPIMLGISFQVGSSWVLPMNHFQDKLSDITWEEALQLFGREIIENKEIVKVNHNYKYEYIWFKKYGIITKGRIFDTMLAKHLLDEERPSDLKSLVDRFLPYWAGYGLNTKLIGWWKKYTFLEIAKYCGIDTDATLRLMVFFEPKLITGDFYKLFRSMQCPATINLGNSEYHGMMIDSSYLQKLIKIYGNKIRRNEKKIRGLKKVKKFNKARRQDNIMSLVKEVKAEIYDLQMDDASANDRKIKTRQDKISRYIARDFTTKKERKAIEDINFGSPDQMIEFLYTHKKGLRLPIKDKTKTGKPSTGEDTLLKLKGLDKWGFIDQLLKYRELQKLYSTYIISTSEQLNTKGDNTYVHGRILIHGTVTGRYCVSDKAMLKTDIGDISIKKLCPDKPSTNRVSGYCKVLTHTGEYKNVTHGVNKGEEDMYEVKLANGATIECTEGHSFLTNHGWVPLLQIMRDTSYFLIKTL